MKPTPFFLLLALSVNPLTAATGSTPRPEDTPKVEPVTLGLAGEAKPDILRYLNIQTALGPALSPDGKRMAFITDITGQRQLWVMDVAGGWPRQITFGSEGVQAHAWSPKGDWIFYSADRGGNEREAFYLISPDGTKERELLPPSDSFRQFGGFSPDGARIAYAATSEGSPAFDIHLLDLGTGEDRLVLKGRLGLYVVSWSPKGTHVVLHETRGEDANDVYLLDLRSGELTTLFKPEIASDYRGFAWKPDGRGFYVVTDQDRESAGLAWYDLGRRELKWVETPAHDVEQVDMDHDGRYLVWTTNEGGYSALHVRDLQENRDLAAPKLPPGIYGVRWADREPVLALTVNGPQVAGDIWTWDPRTGSGAVRATWSSMAGLDPQSFVIPEALDFPASDGVTLHGLLYLPKGSEGKKPPILLGVHGGPSAQARPGFSPVFQYLLSRGIAVFDLNFRGSTGFGKTFSRLDNGRLRPNAVRDMAEALDFLKKEGRVDASRAAVMGGSYGGYMTFAALTAFPDRFRSGVSFVGVSNWVTALQGASPQLKASDRIEYGNIDDPKDRAFFEEISPIHQVARVKAPLMVLHGANDPRDPATESDTFVEGIRQNGGEVEYLRFPDEGHGIRKLANRVAAFRRVAAFLERTLRP